MKKLSAVVFAVGLVLGLAAPLWAAPGNSGGGGNQGGHTGQGGGGSQGQGGGNGGQGGGGGNGGGGGGNGGGGGTGGGGNGGGNGGNGGHSGGGSSGQGTGSNGPTGGGASFTGTVFQSTTGQGSNQAQTLSDLRACETPFVIRGEVKVDGGFSFGYLEYAVPAFYRCMVKRGYAFEGMADYAKQTNFAGKPVAGSGPQTP